MAATANAAAGTAFAYPPNWSWPPFFTEQHAERTASRQRSQWVDLIRSYAAHHGLARVSLHSYTAASDAAAAAAAAASAGAPAAAAAASAVAASSASAADRDAALVNKLFRNDAIQRSLTPDFARRLLDAVAADGWGAWEDAPAAPTAAAMAFAAPNRSLFVLSPLRRLGELADALWSYVESTGESGALVTLYELQTGDAARGQTFFGAEAMLLLQAARILEQRGKAAVIPAPVLSETGVKFLG